MEPEISRCDALTFVGMETRFLSVHSQDLSGPEVLGALWERFLPRVGEIPKRQGCELYGIVRELPESVRSHPREHYYLAGAMVKAPGDIPPGMVVVTVPEATYARFVHKGPLRNLGQTLATIYQSWFPTSGYTRSGFADLEVYGELFRPDHDDSQMEYWVPIEPVAR
jgi:AraC family transcriptional regulator